MKPLKEILTVKIKTATTLLLEVKPNSQIDLIEHGFNGNEKMFRLQIDNPNSWSPSKSYTPFFEDELRPGHTYEWGGLGGTTLASEKFTTQRNKIIQVAHELGFKI